MSNIKRLLDEAIDRMENGETLSDTNDNSTTLGRINEYYRRQRKRSFEEILKEKGYEIKD